MAVQPDGFRVLAGDEIGVGKFAFAIFDADALSGEFEDSPSITVMGIIVSALAPGGK